MTILGPFTTYEEARLGLQSLYCASDEVRIRKIPSSIVEQLMSQCITQVSSGAHTLDLSMCTELGRPLDYYGNAGAVALGLFIKRYLPGLRRLCLRGAIADTGLTNPSTIVADTAFQQVLDSLKGTKVAHLDVSEIPLGAKGYKALSVFLKDTPSVTSMKWDGCMLSEGEERALLINIERNVSRSVRSPPLTSPKQEAHSSSPPNKATKQLYFPQSEFNRLLIRPAVSPLGLYSIRDGLSTNQRSKLPSYESLESHLHIVITDGFRKFPKNNDAASHLRELLYRLPSIKAYFSECFPKYVESPVGEALKKSGVHKEMRQVLDVGPSLDDEESERVTKIQASQKEQILDFLITSLHYAKCANGEQLVEAGDSCVWISILDEGQQATLQAKKGQDVIATFPPLCFVGDHEVLSKHSTRQFDIIVQCPEGESVGIWQLSKELYQQIFIPTLMDRRRVNRKFIETFPPFVSLSTMARLVLCDHLTQIEVDVAALLAVAIARDTSKDPNEATLPTFAVMDGHEMAKNIIFIEEGSVTLRKGISDVREYLKGDIIYIEPSDALMLVTSPVKQLAVKLQIMDRDGIAFLPKELQQVLNKVKGVHGQT